MSYFYDNFFGNLNEKQTQALLTTNDSLLQIIAGPGTGKTKLLISRVAYLLLHYQLPSSSIIVTTFTKKAANEMKERLQVLFENHHGIDISKLQIGTFHSICFRYLRYYGKLVGLKNNFKIADTRDQKDLLSKAISILKLDDIKTDKSSLKSLHSYISYHKSLGHHPEDVRIQDPNDSLENQRYQLYLKYQELLTKNSMIDFDDILVYTNKLLTIRPECAFHIKHVLVDEFQDTNTIQLQLIFKFSQYCDNNITIVGDADQSIYGFRNAAYENFKNMEDMALKKNKNLVRIILNQNYRSSSSILKISEQVMRKQIGREDKVLISNNKSDYPVYYIQNQSREEEAVFISDKIKNLIKQDSDSNYSYKDVSIIARVSRTFLSIEKELSRKGIPYKIVKGHSFWELKEISMTIDCLRIISLDDWLSYKRVVDWFAIGCGPKLIEKIESSIFLSDLNSTESEVLATLTKFAKGEISGATLKAKKSLSELICLVEELKMKMKLNEDTLTEFFQFIIKKFDIVQNALRKKTTGNKDEDEIELDISQNLNELCKQLEEYNPEEDELLREAQEEVFKNQDKLFMKQEDEIELESVVKYETNSKLVLVSRFLEHIHLAEILSVEENINEKNKAGKVTLTTIHGSKGLEWPIVFIPSLVNNLLPSKFSLSEPDPDKRTSLLNEERRCFYVALTRAKDYLYLCTYESGGAIFNNATPSRFLQEIPSEFYHDLSPKPKFINEPFNSFKQSFLQAKSKNMFPVPKGKSVNSELYKPKSSVQLLGKDGMIYNPVTGALISASASTNGGGIKKKKRLGMGKPLKQLLHKR
jgi:DNA helicase-2/ATP-dependent DNA helicase PcrA